MQALLVVQENATDPVHQVHTIENQNIAVQVDTQKKMTNTGDPLEAVPLVLAEQGDHDLREDIPHQIDRGGLLLEVHLEAQVINSRIPSMQQTLLPQSFQNIDEHGRQRKPPCLLPKDVILKTQDPAIKIIPQTKTNQTGTHPLLIPVKGIMGRGRLPIPPAEGAGDPMI